MRCGDTFDPATRLHVKGGKVQERSPGRVGGLGCINLTTQKNDITQAVYIFYFYILLPARGGRAGVIRKTG